MIDSVIDSLIALLSFNLFIIISRCVAVNPLNEKSVYSHPNL
jgi:hypothetical protein